jgi:hypothetical protein
MVMFEVVLRVRWKDTWILTDTNCLVWCSEVWEKGGGRDWRLRLWKIEQYISAYNLVCQVEYPASVLKKEHIITLPNCTLTKTPVKDS